MKILITGAAGFIGYHLTKTFLEDEYQVLGVDIINDYYDPNLKLARLEKLKQYNNFKFDNIDISKRNLLAKSFKLFKPNRAINLAAQAGVRYSIDNPYVYLDSKIPTLNCKLSNYHNLNLNLNLNLCQT